MVRSSKRGQNCLAQRKAPVKRRRRDPRLNKALTLGVGLVAIASRRLGVVPVDEVMLNSLVHDGDNDPELSTQAVKMSQVSSRSNASQLTGGDPPEQSAAAEETMPVRRWRS